MATKGVAYTYDGLADQSEYLNTPRLVADDTQKTVWKWEQQEPFGVDAANDDPDGNSLAFEFNLRFPGQYFDRETNLHYNMARDYWPDGGRYVQSDPIGLAGGLNTYAYVRSDPIRLTDADGLVPEPPCGPNIGSRFGNPACSPPPPKPPVKEPEFECKQRCQRDFVGITFVEEIGLHGAGHLVRSIG